MADKIEIKDKVKNNSSKSFFFILLSSNFLGFNKMKVKWETNFEIPYPNCEVNDAKLLFYCYPIS